MSFRITLALIAIVALGVAAPTSAQPAANCDLSQRKGPVSLLVLASAAKVHKYAATVTDTPVASRDATTVAFADGLVVTSDVSRAGDHINALGWGSRPIKMMASYKVRRWRPAGGFG